MSRSIEEARRHSHAAANGPFLNLESPEALPEFIGRRGDNDAQGTYELGTCRRDDPVLDRGTPSMNCLESRAFRKTTVC